MSRTIPHKARQSRRRKLLQLTRGYRGTKHSNYKLMKQAVNRARAFAYRDRRNRRRDLRGLWIVRINAACRMLGGSYSRFMDALKKSNVVLDRKVLAHLAATDFVTFKAVYEQASGTKVA